MAGQPGRSGGSNRLSVEEHFRRGTYSPIRHGPLPPHLLPSPPAAPAPPPAWAPAPEDLASLGEPGRRFLTQILEQADLSFMQGVLLLEAAHVLDGLATWRAAAATDKQSARLALAYAKTFAALLAQMRVW